VGASGVRTTRLTRICWFTIRQALTKQAQRRLEAIQQMEELGSGFYLAMHDLEIRGTGEVLGDKQSGEIHEIGFQLYTDMLNDAVLALKEGKEPDLNAPLAATTEINLHAPAILPADYCGDVQERLSLYKRMANCETSDSIDSILEELIDRFGKLPPQAQRAGRDASLRLAAKPLGISRSTRPRMRSRCSSSRTRRRRDEDHRDGAEEQAHQARGAGQAAHRSAQSGSGVRISTVKETLRALGAPVRQQKRPPRRAFALITSNPDALPCPAVRKTRRSLAGFFGMIESEKFQGERHVTDR
jgi:transcription-repair coupling factor (superfamily II helicase)